MKKVLGFFSLILLTVPIFTPAFGQEDFVFDESQEPEISILREGETHEGDYFALGEAANISGTVTGDAYAFAGRVVVDGTVNGDLIAAGGEVVVEGNVGNDVRVVGGQVRIEGEVGGNITVAGGNVEIDDEAAVEGSLVSAAGNLLIDSPIGREANLTGGTVTIASRVSGNVRAGVGQLVLRDEANVSGNLDYWSEEEIQQDEGASVSGEIRQHMPPVQKEEAENIAESFLTGITSVLTIISFLSTLVLGLIFLKFLPLFANRVVARIEKNPLQTLGVGLLIWVLAPVIFGVLLVTIVGIPIAVLVLFYLVFTYIFAKIFASLWLGGKALELMNQKAKIGWVFLLGLTLLYVLKAIPVLGTLLGILAVLAGTGAFVKEKWETYDNIKKKKLV